jgi:hypothetical protein
MNEVKQVEVTSLAEITRSEIDIQISTAKKYPRSIQAFRQEAMTMATEDKQIAASCFYKLRRKDSIIEGPSVRLAEIIASAWGNVRYGARVIEETATEVKAQGICHDLEKNVSTSIEVSRRITGSSGQRFSADMIQVTKNAACSIALRNAIFKTIPYTYAKEIYEMAKKTAIGSVETIAQQRQEIIKLLKQMSVTEAQILAAVEKPSVEDIGLAEIETLMGFFNAIKDGDSTIEEQFGNGKTASPVADPFAQKQTVGPVEDDTDKIIGLQNSIEVLLAGRGKPTTFINKLSVDLMGKTLKELSLSEMQTLKIKVEAM